MQTPGRRARYLGAMPRKALALLLCLGCLASSCGPPQGYDKPLGKPDRPPETTTCPSEATNCPPQSAADNQAPRIGSPVWNAWLETPFGVNPSYFPIDANPSGQYAFVVALSAVKLSNALRSGVYSRVASTELSQILEDLKKQSDEQLAQPMNLEVLIVPDAAVFEPPDKPEDNWTTIAVHADRIKRALESGVQIPANPLEVLRMNGDAVPFMFGQRLFRLKTRSDAHGGWASIAISIWQNGRPVDEVPALVCITDATHFDCEESEKPNAFALTGVDLTGHKGAPAAALHFLDRYSTVLGVFHCHDCSGVKRFNTWVIHQTGPEFTKALHEITDGMTVMVQPGDQTTESPFEVGGDRLRRLMFPSAEPEAGQAVLELGSVITTYKNDKHVVPSIYVRMLGDAPATVLLPLNLMRLKVGSSHYEYIGRVAKLETPLERQDFSSNQECLRNWRMFVPPEPKDDKELDSFPMLRTLLHARTPLEPWIHGLREACDKCIMQSEASLRAWISEGQPVPAGQVLLTISHHDADKLFFRDGTPIPFVATDVGRRFERPSVAILAGCGTAQVGASGIVRALNEHGINTVIATATEVNAKMAGQFVDLLLTNLAQHASDTEYTLADARYDATVRLFGFRDESHRPYGPKALEFIIAGNGALHVCAPNRLDGK
jgi:hypothetical protein